MASQVSAPYRYYLYEEATSIIWYTETFPDAREDLVLLGRSNNPIPASAATAFMQERDKPSGWQVKEL